MFGRHLEGLRRGLQQAYGQYETQCLALATTLEGLRAEAADEITAERLADLVRQTCTLTGSAAEGRSARQTLDQAYAAFARAVSLLHAAVFFERGLPRLGTAGLECREGLDALTHDISAAFATQREGALGNVSAWETRLAQLQQRAADIEQQQRAEFEAWQEDFHSALSTHLDLSQAPAPRLQLLDSSNPQDSRDRVIEGVQHTIKGVIKGLVEDCRVTHGALAAIAHSGDLAALPADKRDSVIQNAEQCQSLWQHVQQRVGVLIKQASENPTDIFGDPSGAFDRYCRTLGQLQQEVCRMLNLLQQVENALAEARLTEQELKLLDAIQALATHDGQGVDLGLLLSSSGQTIGTLMPLLGALYTKRKLYVTIDPVRQRRANGDATASGQE